MKVWIDQDLCTGDGLCEEIAPTVFTLLDDGLAYVKEGDKVFSSPGGPEGLASSRTTCSKPRSSPPRSAPASASSSRPSSAEPVDALQTPQAPCRGVSRVRWPALDSPGPPAPGLGAKLDGLLGRSPGVRARRSTAPELRGGEARCIRTNLRVSTVAPVACSPRV